MLSDHDDTVVRAARPAEPPRRPDLDDTVARGAPPAVPPALVEPPAPATRPLPLREAPAPAVEPPAPESPAPEPSAAPAYRALLLDGTEIPIDRPVYVGRKPAAPRIHTGPAPRLVTLPSPGRELSATHLELRLVGAALVASDMRSTNGTVVRVPGTAPRTLIRGESAVVVPGTRIDLGEGAVLDILAGAAL